MTAVRTSKQWISEAMEDLQACLDCTDLDVFRIATNSLDEFTKAMTSYIFCEDSCVPSCTRASYSNDKHWFTAKLRQLQLEKCSGVGTKTGLKNRSTGLAKR